MKKLITYLFPIYNEEANIDHLYEVVNRTTIPLVKKYDLEILFVNDGSRDNSLVKLLAIQKIDKRVRIINFARNFGHQVAVTAGLDHAKGDAVVIMDADLQDPPTVSLELIEKWEKGYDVVYAQRRSRKDTFFKKLSAYAFYRVLDVLSEVKIPKDTGDFRLIDRKVVEVMKKLPEHNRFLRGMVSFVGFKQIAVQFDRDERFAGVTNYPLKKMLKLAGDAITSFSRIPLQLITNAGIILLGLCFLVLVVFLVLLIIGKGITDVALIVWAISFFSGVQLVAIGIVGTYTGRIYTEVQNRPIYIIENIYE